MEKPSVRIFLRIPFFRKLLSILALIINTGCTIDAYVDHFLSKSPAAPLILKNTAKQIVSGESSNCVLLKNSRVKCWGENWAGQLGLGDSEERGNLPEQMGNNLPYVDLGSDTAEVVHLTAGRYHVCALFSDGKIKCWGYNSDGQLGLGDDDDRGDEPGEMGDNLPYVDLGANVKATQVVAGGFHTCAILNNNRIKCWGSNGGILGLEDIENHGDEPNEMGDNLPYVDLGLNRTVLQISGGDGHTCALLDNKKIKCWGYNSRGQLGQGDQTTRGSAPGEMGDNLPYVDLGSGYIATDLSITSGDHTCALLADSRMKCWGYNYTGELGIGDSNHRGDAPGEMGDSLPSVDLGTGRHPIRMVTGRCRSCALLDNKQLKCWAWNAHPSFSASILIDGVLGLGDTKAYGSNPNEMGDNLPSPNLGTDRSVIQMSSGWAHVCAILDNGGVKCWGVNWGGLLGQGDELPRSALIEMGDNLPEIDFGDNSP